jgi:sugar transferase (PEP-CTERM/EpsH1 system associated)
MEGELMTESAASAIRAAPMHAGAPLVVHVIHALRMGGMENGLVNLINGMDPDRYRHAVVCASDFSDFRDRIRRPGVEVIALHKDDLSRAELLRKLFSCFRAWRPAIVHGRNWDGLDAMLPAWASGVPVRIQGEHGRDMHDLDGSSRRQQWLRRVNRPFTTHYATVSRDLGQYLCQRIGIKASRITQIYNGVDTDRFHPAAGGRAALPGVAGLSAQHFVVGTVGRLVPVKDQMTLIRACARLVQADSRIADRLQLVIVGDGPLRAGLEAEVRAAGLERNATFAGAREDVADWLRGMDLFVLPSLAEGISNTILEAMATALPVIATDVGGNADLVVVGETGRLMRSGDAETLASYIRSYLENPTACRMHGLAARARAQSAFSIGSMVERYLLLYDRLLSEAGIQDGGLARVA